MLSLFSKLIDYGVATQFRNDPSGRAVFLPYGPRKNAYFVDSKADEEKIRSFVKLYRSASTLVSWLGTIGIFVFDWCWTSYASAEPLRSRETALIVSSSLYLLFIIV